MSEGKCHARSRYIYTFYLWPSLYRFIINIKHEKVDVDKPSVITHLSKEETQIPRNQSQRLVEHWRTQNNTDPHKTQTRMLDPRPAPPRRANNSHRHDPPNPTSSQQTKTNASLTSSAQKKTTGTAQNPEDSKHTDSQTHVQWGTVPTTKPPKP